MPSRMLIVRADITTIAVDAIVNAGAHPEMAEVTFCCFSDEARRIYEKVIAAAGALP